MSGNLTAVREMSGILLKIREMSGEKILSGKSCLKLFIVNCIFVSIQVFSRTLLCLIVKYMVLDHVLLYSYPTTDSNTSTGMIWVTLNMPSATEECREPSGICRGISHCLETGHPDSCRTCRPLAAWHSSAMLFPATALFSYTGVSDASCSVKNFTPWILCQRLRGGGLLTAPMRHACSK